MHWFFIALIAPILWSIVNHIDKYLLSRYLKVDGIGALMIFSSLAGILILPVSYFIYPTIFVISLLNIGILILAGILSALAIFFYFRALFEGEASYTVPLFQIIPIFGIFLGYIFLGEILTKLQLISIVFIVLGAMILSFEKTKSGLNFRKKIVVSMLISSFLFALYETLFKVVAIEENFWLSLFWQNVGLLFFGLILFIFVKSYREQFLSLLKNNGLRILSLNIYSETSSIVGNILFAYATLLAPIALVMTVNVYQPVFVFIIGTVLSLFLPSLSQENTSRQALIQKFIGIGIILIGSYLIYF